MPLLESILMVWETAVGVVAGVKELRNYLNEKAKVQEILSDLVEMGFQQHLPRLQHLCPDGIPCFDKKLFTKALTTEDFKIETIEDLIPAILPHLVKAVSTPGATCGQEDFMPVYKSILDTALRGMWKKIAAYDVMAKEILLKQNEASLKQQHAALEKLNQEVSGVKGSLGLVETNLKNLTEGMTSFANFAQGVWTQVYDKLIDSAPPAEHTIDKESYINPFLLARAEDFNHNYIKLARLFQNSPEWDAIQSRTDNVFIEGGRGTGKSMILRRLTAQATIAAERLKVPSVIFDDLSIDYFGVYVKLTRGYYDHFSTIDTISSAISSLLAQHELNIEIFDAFANSIQWLHNERALPSVSSNSDLLITDLASLFPRAPKPHTLDDLQKIIVQYEQDQINSYYREKAFGGYTTYMGSARDTVAFMRQLSHIFRDRLFPRKEMRLFLLIDEFETLLEVQQMALNTVMKMRLPDLSTKIAVRKSGRKTADTFTPGDPIQDPRDYIEVRFDYDVTSPGYSELLKGIATKRLEVAGYQNTEIRSYLCHQGQDQEVPIEQLNAELERLWQSGQRQADKMNEEFGKKYETAAIYRILSRAGKRKSFAGFDQFVHLSSGIVSNFIELCKYAFYFALSDQLPLKQEPKIPSYLQTEAAYRVSQRLLSKIDGNVPIVGSVLGKMLTDLGEVLRNRLLQHPSEPEANRLAIDDYGELSQPENGFLAKVIDEAIIWSVLHLKTTGEAFRPKSAARPPSAELIINRIYCPALRISPRARWRVKINLSDLNGLIDQKQRAVTYKRLMRTIGTASDNDSSQGTLFS